MVTERNHRSEITLDRTKGLEPSSNVNITSIVGAIDELRVKIKSETYDVVFSNIINICILFLAALVDLAAHVKSDRMKMWSFGLGTMRERIGMERIAYNLIARSHSWSPM